MKGSGQGVIKSGTKLIAPDGIMMVKKIDVDASEIDITPSDWPLLDTTGWDVGKWKAKIVSDKQRVTKLMFHRQNTSSQFVRLNFQ